MDNTRWIDLPKQARVAMEDALKKELANFRRPKIAVFASPEAESARNSIDSVEDEVLLTDAKTEKDSCIGLDIELKESPRFERKQNTAWEKDNGKGKQMSAAGRRWKKAAITTKLCVDFSKKKTDGTQSDNTSSHEDKTTTATPNRRRWRRAAALSRSMNVTPLNMLNDVKKSTIEQAKKDNDSAQVAKTSDSLQIPDIDHDKQGANEKLISSPCQPRFGRRLSPQVSRSLPDKFRPSPPPTKRPVSRSRSDSHAVLSQNRLRPPRRTSSPSLSSSRSSSPTSSVSSSPGVCRRKLSLAIDCHSSQKLYSNCSRPNSASSSTSSSSMIEKRKLSLASDLETNRSIVSDLMHQRSEAISHLSDDLSSSIGKKASTESVTSENSFLLPLRCKNTQPRQAWEAPKVNVVFLC